MMALSDKAAILDYWRAVELFSPQNVPRVAPNDHTEPVFSAQEDRSASLGSCTPAEVP